MSYRVEILPRAMKELKNIPNPFYQKIIGTIDDLKDQPRPLHTIKLKGQNRGWRIKVGDYRILYEIYDESHIVKVFRVRHRKEAYR